MLVKHIHLQNDTKWNISRNLMVDKVVPAIHLNLGNQIIQKVMICKKLTEKLSREENQWIFLEGFAQVQNILFPKILERINLCQLHIPELV